MSFNKSLSILAVISVSLILLADVESFRHKRPEYKAHLNYGPGEESHDINYNSYYTFNVTNPDEVELGENPVLAEVGPYVYKEIRTRYNIASVNNGTALKFQLFRTYHFAPELSEGHLETDLFNFINIPLFAAASTMHRMNLPGAFNNIIMEELIENGESLVLKNVSFGDYHFYGVNASIYTDIMADFGEIPPEFSNGLFAFLKGKNATDEGEYVIQSTGPNIGDVISFNGKSSVDFYNGEKCNEVDGTDGYFFRPGITSDTPLKAFYRNMCRNLQLKYNGQEDFQGIPVEVFTFPDDMLDNGVQNPDNICFCTWERNQTAPTCLKKGVQDSSGCSKGAPLAVSKPHLLDADEVYQKQSNGLNPDPLKHETKILVEPVTGTIVMSDRKLQINMDIQPFNDIDFFRNISSRIFPMGWIKWSLDVPESKIIELKDWLKNKDDKDLYEHDYPVVEEVDNSLFRDRVGMESREVTNHPRTATSPGTSSSSTTDVLLNLFMLASVMSSIYLLRT